MDDENKRHTVHPMFILVKFDCANGKGRTFPIYGNVIRSVP